MIIDQEHLHSLMSRVDKSIDNLLLTIQTQELEISKLKEENIQLNSKYSKILKEVEQYVTELEQIKQSLCQ